MQWLFIFLALAVAGISAPSAVAGDVDIERQAVLKAVGSLDAALLARNARTLDALLDQDFIGTVPSGVALARDAYVAFHTRPNEGLVAIETAAGTEPTVRIFDGRFAVVNRRVAVRRADPTGQVEGFEVQRIEVLRLDDGHWRIVSGQGTRLQH